MVNQLLTEMDGLETRQQVFIMAATNRPGKTEVYETEASKDFQHSETIQFTCILVKEDYILEIPLGFIS